MTESLQRLATCANPIKLRCLQLISWVTVIQTMMMTIITMIMTSCYAETDDHNHDDGDNDSLCMILAEISAIAVYSTRF